MIMIVCYSPYNMMLDQHACTVHQWVDNNIIMLKSSKHVDGTEHTIKQLQLLSLLHVKVYISFMTSACGV